MDELREDLSQSDKLISALLPAYISIYFEKKLRLDRGTTNQSDTRFSILTRGKSEMNLSPSRRIQQRVFTVIKKSLFFHIEHLFFLYINLIDFILLSPHVPVFLVFVDKRKANIEEYEIKKKKKRKRRTSNFYFLSGKSTNNIYYRLHSLFCPHGHHAVVVKDFFLPNLALSMQITTEPHTNTKHVL